jgi:translation initiation factor 4G
LQEGIAAEDVDEALARQKLRMLGNIKFIGELFKLNQLTNKIMHACIQQLLTPKDGQTVPSEEALESLCQLLTTVCLFL